MGNGKMLFAKSMGQKNLWNSPANINKIIWSFGGGTIRQRHFVYQCNRHHSTSMWRRSKDMYTLSQVDNLITWSINYTSNYVQYSLLYYYTKCVENRSVWITRGCLHHASLLLDTIKWEESFNQLGKRLVMQVVYLRRSKAVLVCKVDWNRWKTMFSFHRGVYITVQ